MIQILGLCKTKISLLYDLLYEQYNLTALDIFLNMELDLEIPFNTYKISASVHSPLDLPDINLPCIFGGYGPGNKKAVFNSFGLAPGIKRENFLNIIHPSAEIARSSILGQACIIESLVSISSQTIIGFGVDIKRGVQVGHHNLIGDYCDINPGAVICGNVTIGTECKIGAGAILKDGITIGSHSVIGMGSVVTKSIPSGVVAYGNPCKIVKDIPLSDKTN